MRIPNLILWTSQNVKRIIEHVLEQLESQALMDLVMKVPHEKKLKCQSHQNSSDIILRSKPYAFIDIYTKIIVKPC